MQYVQVYSCALQNVWTIHMPIALEGILFSKKHGDQMVSPCPTMAATLYPVQGGGRKENPGEEGSRRKGKGDEIDGTQIRLLSIRYTLPETNSEFSPENQWLVQMNFLLRWPICRCELSVSGSVFDVLKAGSLAWKLWKKHRLESGLHC